jgi:threonylcarbamoyladenosine tRNA methylthiotransferase MtaB
MKKMKIALYTLGCKLNHAETDELKENLQNEGFFIVDWGKKADVYIINACGLTVGAEQGTRQIIRQAHRRNQKSKIFVTGCFKQKMAEVDYYARNQRKLIKKIKIIAKNTPSVPPFSRGDARGISQNRTRAFIKIQTGCDNFCSYCVIPYFRGKPKSVNAEKIIKVINHKVAQNFKEIVLTGVNICKYNDLHRDAAASKCKRPLNLTWLTQKILNETKIQRIRFGSLDPSLINDDLISLFHNPQVMPHMHLSLQSGSNRVLKLMNRKYTAPKYLSLVKKIKRQFPLTGFTTDVIVGFPGETEKNFRDTCNFIKKVGFLKVHIFPFSPRPGTAAAKMDGQIDEKIKKDRFGRLAKIADATRKNFIKKMIGQTVSVLFEEKTGNEWFGYTPNYLRVKFRDKQNLNNKIVDIEINRKKITALLL